MRRPNILSLFLSVISLLSFSTISLASPRPRRESTPAVLPHSIRRSAQVQNLNRITYSYPPPNSTNLSNREIQNGLDLLTADWVGFFSHVNTFMPIADALPKLHEIYTWVFDEAIAGWLAEEPETDAFAMTNGMLRLEMLGENGALIPWMFVQTFVAKLGAATQQGFAGSYRAYYKNPVTGVAVTVVMTLLFHAAPAAR